MNIPIVITAGQQTILDVKAFDIMVWAKATTEAKIASMNTYPEMRMPDEKLTELGRTKTATVANLEVDISGSNIVVTVAQNDFLQEDMVDLGDWMQNAVDAQVQRLQV